MAEHTQCEDILKCYNVYGWHVYVDYFHANIRVAALAELQCLSYLRTHESIGVGEDGPTHQPVETVSELRLFPNLMCLARTAI